MPLLATVLVSFMFIPGSVLAPVAHAKTTATLAQASGEEPSPSPVAPVVKTAVTRLTVKLTSYNAVPEQTDGNPTVTASGIPSNSEVIAARSHDLASKLPFGTVIAIYREANDSPACGFSKVQHLIGYRVIADTTNARFSKRVDVELDAADKVVFAGRRMNPSRVLGVCSGVSVEVVGRLKLGDVPDTQAELAALINPPLLALAK